MDVDLIDLSNDNLAAACCSIETENSQNKQHNPSKETDSNQLDVNCHVASTNCDNINFVNNPFDAVQQLAEVYDPFEVLEQQAGIKNEQLNTTADVKMANLLSLSDDNILDELPGEEEKKTDTIVGKAATPPNWSSSSCSNSGSSTEVGSSGKTRKAFEFRKRFLKHRMCNSTFNSPLSNSSAGEQRSNQNACSQAAFSGIGGDCTFNDNSPLRKLLSAESPISLVDDEQPSWIDSEKDFEAELESLKIPILQQMPTSDLSAEKLAAEHEELKKQASTLLDSLGSPTKRKRCTSQGEQQQLDDESVPVPPPAIARQGTFDIDLKDDENEDETQIQNIPDIMVASSATYDGEPADEKQRDFELPVVEPILEPVTPPNPAPRAAVNNVQATPYLDVNNLVEQLGRLLEQHQQDHSTAEGGSSTNSTSSNPTFIVVMNSAQINTISPSDQSVNDFSSDTSEASQAPIRRRSQSLSLHDKITVLQLPVPAAAPVNQNDSVEHSHVIETPVRRRNSFSFTTPTRFPQSKTQTSMLRPSPGFSTLQRKSLAPANISRCNTPQTSAPKPMPKLQLNAMKPDLQKRRQRMNSGSIMKSTGPMKATLSVKNMLASSGTSKLPATPRAKSTNTLNDSLQILKSGNGRSSHLSTPIPQSMRHSLAPLSEDSHGPNACSTPAPYRPRTSSAGSSSFSGRHSTSFTTPKAEGNKPPVFAPSGIASIRRRTVSELSSGSPSKLATRTSAAAVGRNSTKAVDKIVKPANKPANTNSNFRPPTRLRFHAPAGSQKSKENKQP